MNLLDLLDQIDDTAPRSCQTCLWQRTREKCEGCLRTEADLQALREGRGNELPEEFRYLHWTPGNWLRHWHAAQVAGKSCIVVGGQGEADVYATNPPSHTSERLNYVAGEVGYVACGLRTKGSESRKQIYTSEGRFELVWRDDQLERIDRIKDDADEGVSRTCTWHRDYPLPEMADKEKEHDQTTVATAAESADSAADR